MTRHDPASALLSLVPALSLVLVLAGCATTTSPTSSPTPPSTGATSMPEVDPATALATEREWLQQWFKGTPVAIDQRRGGPVSVEVPREFSFDAGRNAVKPALGAVLDKVAESLRRSPSLRLQQIAAPGDTPADAALALRRATQMRTHLVSRGVPALQLGTPEAATTATVQLRLEITPR